MLGASASTSLRQVSDYTGQPEMQGGLVKTLDFKIYLGLLSETDNASHRADLARTGAAAIDMVVVNLYPFEQTVAAAQATLEDARANIDIGGPCMVRAAAKNFHRVAVLADPSDYPAVVEELAKQDGTLRLATRYRLAQKAFRLIARYDAAIADYLDVNPASRWFRALRDQERGLTRVSAPDFKTAYRRIMDDHFPGGMEISFVGEEGRQTLVYEKATWVINGEEKGLRYGENPGQEAALYRLVNGNLTLGATTMIAPGRYLASDIELLQSGKHPGKINITDADNALNILRYFGATPFAVIVKHNNPCGAAKGRHPCRGLSQGAHGGPSGRIRRSNRAEPGSGQGDGRADRRDLCRGRAGPRVRAGRHGDLLEMEESPRHAHRANGPAGRIRRRSLRGFQEPHRRRHRGADRFRAEDADDGAIFCPPPPRGRAGSTRSNALPRRKSWMISCSGGSWKRVSPATR